MAKIAVVEDNTAVREELCGFIAKYAQESGRKLDVTPFADGSQIVEPYRPDHNQLLQGVRHHLSGY